MKLLVSDFDGTLVSKDESPYDNIMAVKRFRNSGNKFAVSTGRNYESIKNALDGYHIEYDYLFCNDGLVCYDKNENLIYLRTIPDEIINDILDYIECYDKTLLYYLYDKTQKVNSWREITEIQVLVSNFIRAKKFASDFKDNFQCIDCSSNFGSAFIRPFYNKALGLAKFLELNDENYENIITVGDAKNDLELLTNFDGYKVFCSSPALYFKGIKNTYNVSTLIKKITK